MAYAIIRIEKRKIGSCAAIEKHHERKKEQYKSNPDIDPALTPLNYHLVQPTKSYRMMALERIEEVGAKRRKDSVAQLIVPYQLYACHSIINDIPKEKTC